MSGEERTAGGARGLALNVLRRVVERGAYSNLALASALARSKLRPADRALATELTYGTLRRMVRLDFAIEDAARRPIERISPLALQLTRLGAYQLLFTRIPAHAAVGETVGLAPARERGFVNAVLRRLAAHPPVWPEGRTPEATSVRTGLATWAVIELIRLLGPDEAEPAAAALAERSALTVRVNTCRIDVAGAHEALVQAGVNVRRGGLHEDALILDGASPERLPGWGQGWFAVQDQASMLVVDALEPLVGARVIDVCAGPGGKTGHLACRVSPGGVVVAGDPRTQRMKLVLDTARRLGVRVLGLAQDARRPGVRGGFDRVLVDAPCSGLGAARGRPELLWRPKADEVSELARLQIEIVSSAAELLTPGGLLVYSVCTFPTAETDAVCGALPGMRPDLVPEAVPSPDGRAERFRLWPHRQGTDGMFVAGFRRAG